MKIKRYADITLKAGTAALLAVALILTFTASDYYIFNRISQFGFFFCLAQWVKKACFLLFPLAAYYGKKSCADIAKYSFIFIPLSCALFGGFFDVLPAPDEFAQINGFIGKTANMALFFTENALHLILCAALFIRDGFKVKAKSFIYLPFAMVGCMPLNIFENFFDINKVPADSLLRFNSFTVWHAVAILLLAGFTIGVYYFLRGKDRKTQEDWLIAGAIVMLIQYHSKDSMVIGDGYNVYHSVLACVPLFICNIGVYIAALAVILKRRTLYSTAFFVHAAGAITVFVYFGKPEMSNYGIFCSYSILYFCLTHCLLFALSVMPVALGHYRWVMKDCIIPIIYYFVVIIIASVASALVTSAYMNWGIDEMPNYAFTQINPLPFEVPPVIKLRIWRYDVNVLYVLGLWAAYVAIFFAFNGAYYAFMAVRKKVLSRRRAVPDTPIPAQNAAGEAAVTDETPYEETAAKDETADGKNDAENA